MMRISLAGKKIIWFVLALLLVPVAVYAAPDRTGKWDAGFNVSGVFPSDSDADNSVYIGGNLAYGVTDWFAVGVESGWSRIGTSIPISPGVTLDAGDLTGIPLLSDLIVRVPIKDSQVQPYGVLGGGVIFWSFDESSLLKAAGVTVNPSTSFAAKLGGGLDWFINDKTILNFETSYVFSNADITASGGGVRVTDSINTDYWMIGAGMKFVF